MSVGWSRLPLLPLRCVLDNLSTEDALSATSTCQHWRSAILFYEGHKELLKLEVSNLEKSMFLARIFKKHTRRLHIYINTTGDKLESFMDLILPLFFDTLKLNELAFIGPKYLLKYQQQTTELKRIVVESLVFKHLHCLQRLVLIGCEMGTPQNEDDRYVHRHVEYYSRPLSFSMVPSPEDTVLSRCNVGLMMFSTLQNISIDYEFLSTAMVATLSQLPQLSLLTLNIRNKRPFATPKDDWPPPTLNVAINMIDIPVRRINLIIKEVFVDRLLLVSLKVMFCKTFHVPLLTQLSRRYKDTLQELVWVDAPAESNAAFARVVKPEPYDMCVNHILLLCWQCVHLKRLVIHGYWLWHYDMVGIARLRRHLRQLEVSAVYRCQNQFGTNDNAILRVLASDSIPELNEKDVDMINEQSYFKWEPCLFKNLHPALKTGATSQDLADYVMKEAAMPILF